MREEFIRKTCEKYNLDTSKLERLIGAWREIEEKPEVQKEFYKAVGELCRVREDGEFRNGIDLSFETEYPDCTKFLLLLACVEVSEQELIQRGIPKEYYEEIPGHRISPHLQKYQETGNCEVVDFPWDRNFYTHSIFLLDRFYFIPCRFGDPFSLYRNEASGEVVGIYAGGCDVAADGQIIERQDASVVAFQTVFEETETEIAGNYMNPCGFVSKEIRRISKAEWKKVLKPGDGMLALHIPSGEGYHPSRLQKSMELALSFFKTYFPEIEIRGFWSESWLYDNRLSFLLPEKSNIVSVQRRLYNYSIGGDSRMLKKEVFGSENADLSKVKPKTTLQEEVLTAFADGNHFCRTSMIVLPEGVPVIEAGYPYIKDSDLMEFERVVGALWKQA